MSVIILLSTEGTTLWETLTFVISMAVGCSANVFHPSAPCFPVHEMRINKYDSPGGFLLLLLILSLKCVSQYENVFKL